MVMLVVAEGPWSFWLLCLHLSIAASLWVVACCMDFNDKVVLLCAATVALPVLMLSSGATDRNSVGKATLLRSLSLMGLLGGVWNTWEAAKTVAAIRHEATGKLKAFWICRSLFRMPQWI
eukprot:TRINITY_DN85408_c0_g1_i1.p2 TRINITY_DN85408_c0_g1~~TRINITY_DN85408_c0_g1_i1.p2  ORF type:complete len:140 (-),score=22.31 TRINITY_DN85408_c0_g1_i1:101-460(-)